MLQDSAAPQRAGGDDPPAALLARIRRQPHPAPLRPGLPAAGKLAIWPSGPTTSSTSRSGCCGTCWAAAARRSRISPRRCWCWPTTSRPAKRPTSTAASSAASSPRSAGRAATRPSWPRPWKFPAVVGTGPFLTDVSGGDLVIIDGDQGLVILQPDEETLARYRHEAEQKSARWPRSWSRSATCRPRPPTACASSCWATSSFPTKSTTASIAAADGVGPVPHRVPLPRRRDRADRGGPLPGLFAAWSQAMGEQAGGDPHVRPGRRQDAATCPRPRTSATRSWACAASAWRCGTCRCSARSCGRSCGPACWATCRSCSR